MYTVIKIFITVKNSFYVSKRRVRVIVFCQRVLDDSGTQNQSDLRIFDRAR